MFLYRRCLSSTTQLTVNHKTDTASGKLFHSILDTLSFLRKQFLAIYFKLRSFGLNQTPKIFSVRFPKPILADCFGTIMKFVLLPHTTFSSLSLGMLFACLPEDCPYYQWKREILRMLREDFPREHTFCRVFISVGEKLPKVCPEKAHIHARTSFPVKCTLHKN